jgi:ankyrin repeat protein
MNSNRNLHDKLYYASLDGHLKVINLLLQDERVDPSARNNVAIRSASQKGHLAVVERLLQDERVDPSIIANAAIRFASMHGHLAVVERLLQDPRVDPSDNNNYSIRYASCCGHLAVVEILLQDPRVDLSANNNDAILWASTNGHLAVFERLIQDERVDPNILHERYTSLKIKEFSENSLMILATKLSKDFPADSNIINWKRRIDKYREELFDLFKMLCNKKLNEDNESNELNHFHGDDMVNLVIEYVGSHQSLGRYNSTD